jgi:hypothetical protein
VRDVIPGVSDLAVAAARRRLATAPPPPPSALTAVPARRGARVVVVAGPGVLLADAAPALRAFAEITGATVVNTVGAKGLFAWDDPLHGGTIGLQRGDAALAEVPTADLLVTTGLDRSESLSLREAVDHRAAADPGSVIDVDPGHLAVAAGGWPPATAVGSRPAFYDRVAAVVGPLYACDPDADGRVPPARAAADLAARLLPGGLVVAPPGPTGFWVGRTFPTTEAGSVVVPTGDPPGTAAALAVLAARAGRPTTLVVPAVAVPVELVGVAGEERIDLGIEVWSAGVAHAVEGTRSVLVDWSVVDDLVAAAGAPDPAVWPDWEAGHRHP